MTSYTDLTVAPETTYRYRVFAYSAAGSSLPSNEYTITTLATPPAAPANLTATPSAPAPTTPTVTLTWIDNATNETGFTIQRATDSAFTVDLTTFLITLANVTTYTDTAVAPKTTYYYRVRASNTSGSSVWSNTGSAVTPGQIPEAPSTLACPTVTKNSVTLSWQDNATNEQGFYVERAAAPAGPFTRVATTPANSVTPPATTTYTNTGLKNNRTYYYRVQAYNADGVTAYTNTAGPCKTKK